MSIPKISVELLATLWDGIKKVGQELSIHNELSYQELVTEIVNQKPKDSRITSAAALKQHGKNKQYLEIVVLYLDKDKQPVMRGQNGIDYGFAFHCLNLDPELLEFFGDSDLLVFE